MVAGPLETTRIDDFRIDGPWPFVDLSGLGSFFTVVESDWFVSGVTGPRLASATPNQQSLDHFWLAPTEAAGSPRERRDSGRST